MNNRVKEKEEIIWEGSPSQIKYLHVDIGIPPDYLILNKFENIETVVDPLIEKAVDIIKN